MSRTYKITIGHQYDREGVSVERDGHYGCWAQDGMHLCGDWPCTEDVAAVTAGVRQVLDTREPVTLTLGSEAPAKRLALDLDDLPGTCPRCGTVCYGDCRS